MVALKELSKTKLKFSSVQFQKRLINMRETNNVSNSEYLLSVKPNLIQGNFIQHFSVCRGKNECSFYDHGNQMFFSNH